MLARRAEGFSVVELMVTVTILTLMLAAAGPSTISWMRASSMKNMAEEVQNGIRLAKSEAMRRHRPVTFWLVTGAGKSAPPDNGCTLSATSASWVISVDNPAGKCGAEASSEDAPRLVQKGGVAPAGGTTVSAQDYDGAAATSVTFDATGRPQTASGQVARVLIAPIDAAARSLQIEISRAGSVRLCDASLEKSSGDPRACRQ